MKGAAFNASNVSLLVALITCAPARANDTLAVLGAGGLELTQSEHTAMLSEDLYLSPSEVRVRYAFRNESDKDITTLVAFPLPAINQGAIANVDLPVPDQPNVVDFHVAVDGKPIQPSLEQKAVTDYGADVTAELAGAGLPVNANLPGWQEEVRALPDDIWRRLVQRKILDYGDGEPNRSDDASAQWSLRATFHWEQTFPAGKTIIVEHRYKPIVGGSIVYSSAQLLDEYAAKYCLDAPGKAGALRLLGQAQAGVRGAEKSVGIGAREVSYVLTTGANWKYPIGNFRLTIDKEKPKAILSLCMSGLQSTGPTTFAVEWQNFIPKADIGFVIFGE